MKQFVEHSIETTLNTFTTFWLRYGTFVCVMEHSYDNIVQSKTENPNIVYINSTVNILNWQQLGLDFKVCLL